MAVFLLDGPDGLKDYRRNEAKNIKRLSIRFKLTDQHLLYIEKGGEVAKCALSSKIAGILRWAHDEHGHFSISITLHKLLGQ